MTQMPPPPSVPYQPGMNQPTNQPAATNVWSIVSLICGIIGCLVVTPFVAVITGIIGVIQARTLKTGRGMAIAGIILGILWLLIGGGLFGMSMYISKHGSTFINNMIGESVKPQLTTVLNELADGDTTAAKAGMPGVSDADLDGLAATLKPMGHVKTIAITSSDSNYSNGVASYTYGGTVTFENGTKNFDAGVTAASQKVSVDRIGIK